MRVAPDVAEHAKRYRSRFVAQVAATVGLEKAWQEARAQSRRDYSIPENAKKPDGDVLAKMLRGAYSCPAYLAHACLDALIGQGYLPDDEDLPLVAVMFLTRSSVKVCDDALNLIPAKWPEDVRDRLVKLMKDYTLVS